MAYASTLEISRDPTRAGRLTGALLGFQACLSLLTVVACLALGRHLYSGVTWVAVVVLSVDLVLKAVKGTLRWLLKGLERFGVEAASLLFERLVLLALGIWSLRAGYGVIGFVLVFAVVRLLDVAALAAYVDRRVLPLRPSADRALWIDLFRKGLPFAYAGLVITLIFQVDALLLEHLRGPREVGYYRAPTQILEGLLLVPRVLGFALIPTMAALYKTAPGAVTSLYRRGCKYLLLAGLPIAAFGALTADRFIPWLFGPSFEPSVVLTRWLLPAAAFMFLSNFAETALACVDRWRTIVIASSLALVLNVALNLAWIPHLGALGAARATLVTEAAYFAMTTLAMSLAGHRIGWPRVVWRPAVAASAFAGTLVIATGLGAPLAAVLASLAFLTSVVLLGTVDAREQAVLRALLRGRAPDPRTLT
jgi:O-antigen/teichoic acid export membrane protein